jgi:hypothetical protein
LEYNVYICTVSSSERKRKEQGTPKTNSRGRQIDNANLKLEQEQQQFSIGTSWR